MIIVIIVICIVTIVTVTILGKGNRVASAQVRVTRSVCASLSWSTCAASFDARLFQPLLQGGTVYAQ